MQTALGWFGAISRGCSIVAGWALLAISFATCIEIVGRKYFGFSFRALDEIGGYLLAALSAFGFAVLATVSLAAMAAFCAWRGGFELLDVLVSGKRSNTPLSVPLWMPQSLWLAGMVLFAVGTILMAIHSLALLMRDRPLLNRTYGPQSLEEEISTEISHLATAEAAEGRRA